MTRPLLPKALAAGVATGVGAELPKPYFLGYQARWLKDTFRFKIARKSRRIGLTYAQSYEDVTDAAKSKASGGMDVWFSSADESAAKEYIRYCAMWAELLGMAAHDLGEVVVDKKDDIKALVIQFASGFRINALSSNPKAFRSKGGKLVLDEFAFHADGEGMWKAARPIITWGYPVRIISTLNGKGNRYYRIVSDTEKAIAEGKQPTWSLHTITIVDAVADGLADKIERRDLTAAERAEWLRREEENVGDHDTWRQEYMCEALDGDAHWLSWDEIVGNESADAGRPELYAKGKVTIGWDVARRKHGSILYVRELVGDVGWCRELVRLSGKKFAEQFAEVDRVMQQYDVLRLCIDQTGMGEKVVEDAKAMWGEYVVEGVLFNSTTKHHLATATKQAFEDRRERMPVDRDNRTAHHAVKKTTTVAGNVRFDADATATAHADEFWAHALAIHAAENTGPPAAGESCDADPDAYRPAARAGRRQSRMFGRRGVRARTGRKPLTARRRPDRSVGRAIPILQKF